MSLHDDELQHQIEKGRMTESSPDSRAYQKVFDALKKEPYQLPFGFADGVIKRMESRESLSKDYFWVGLGLVVFIASAVLAGIYTHFKFDFGAFTFISGYQGLIVFGLAFILMIHYIDRKFLGSR